jgi:hypothetical protein
MLRKLLGWLALAALALWLLHNPAGAAADIRHAIDALTTLTNSI